jgi:transposase
MVEHMDKRKIIELKEAGLSNREVARQTGFDRDTVSKYWNEYRRRLQELEEPGADTRAIQDSLFATPRRAAAIRTRHKYTEEVDIRLKGILKEEEKKTRLLGPCHKQRLTNRQIHQKLVAEGFDVSEGTINISLAKIRKRQREVFIRQRYDLGDRLEYDFGEVDLIIGGVKKVYHMAVLSSPGGGFRWLYLYTNQKKAVFMDSHVRFFEMMGGSYFEVVYDNMRNVVKKFIGKNEKELNEDLLKMASYYGFRINVTNCFKGNEKGHVESSVKILRNQIFAENYTFNSLEDAQEYAYSRLIKMNEGSRMEEEKQYLRPYRPPLELADVREAKVDTCSFVSVDTVKYSVPEHLVGKDVIVKKYHNEIRVFYDYEMVATHKRIFGNGSMQVNIYHYLNTLRKKPGAIRNSVALKSIPRLKAIFDTYYSKQPKKFIELFLANKELPVDEIIALFERETANKGEIVALDVVKPVSQIVVSARAVIANYTALTMGGVQH